MQGNLGGKHHEPELGPLYTPDRAAVQGPFWQNDHVRTEMSCSQVARTESRKRMNMKQA